MDATGGTAMPSIDPADFEGSTAAVLILGAPEPALGLGRLPVIVDSKRCTVAMSKPPEVVHEDSGIRWPLQSRDWCIEVAFAQADDPPDALDSHSHAVALLDRAIAAWNRSSAWLRARDRATATGRLAPWLPRLGRVNARAVAISDSRGHLALWVNPNKGGSLALSSRLPIATMFVTNGPAAMPLPALTERLQEGIDLLNHGFVAEALLTTFSTFEAHLRMAISDSIRTHRGETLVGGRPILKQVRR